MTNGYGIVVSMDYQICKPDDSDLIIWYTNENINPLYKTEDIILSRPRKYCAKRVTNLLLQRFGSEVNVRDLKFLKGTTFDEIFCGDVIFYRAIRYLFPNTRIFVRFHNCFSRIRTRKETLGIHVDPKLKLDLITMSKLEQLIFKDPMVYKIFISEEDKLYYNLITGMNDAKVSGLTVDPHMAKINRKLMTNISRLVWIGGAESHKKISLNWFCTEIFPSVRKAIPNCELHLWGNRTMQFNSHKDNIYAHGILKGNDFPYKDSALFINPDIIGGGVKVKVKIYFEEGLPFISTPYGYEGYPPKLIDNEHCIVAKPEDWISKILDVLRTYGGSGHVNPVIDN